MTLSIAGVGGYVANRHLKAIRDVGGELVAALDPHDAVGILDSYVPGARWTVVSRRTKPPMNMAKESQ